jgi:4-hydroxy-3-methylbut-2-en-1-yl diphosphate reductase
LQHGGSSPNGRERCVASCGARDGRERWRVSVIERVVVISPHGFCAGVVRAVATVERTLAVFGPPVYVRRAIVHNAHVMRRLIRAGAVFVEELDDVPRGSVVVFGAHGVAASVREVAAARELRVVDATCPLVEKVHREVARYRRRGYDVVLVGRAGHDEVVGTLGQARGVQLVQDVSEVSRVRPAAPERVACVTQTTLRPQEVAPVVEALRRRFPALAQPAAHDICYATRNRQAAIEWLARRVDVVLVVGDPASSNSQRLREAAAAAGCAAHLVESAAGIPEALLSEAEAVGVSAGASTPEELVTEVVEHLCRDGATLQAETFLEEHVSFTLPAELVGDPLHVHRRSSPAPRQESLRPS